MTVSDEDQPWDKLHGEPSGAFQAFTFYRDSGPDRSLRATWQHERKSEGQVKAWSVKYSWVARVDAYERHLDRRARAELERGRTEMSKRHIQLSVGLQQKVAQRLANLDANELQVKDIAYWIEIATRLERVSRGLPAGETAMNKLSSEVEQQVKHLNANERRELLAQTIRTIRTRIPEEAGEDEAPV